MVKMSLRSQASRTRIDAAITRALDSRPNGLSFNELRRATRLHQQQISKRLLALQEKGIVAQGLDGRYRLKSFYPDSVTASITGAGAVDMGDLIAEVRGPSRLLDYTFSRRRSR